MTVSSRHVFEQGAVLWALGETAISSLRHGAKGKPLEVPGPWIETHLRPRSPRLVADYVRYVGGDPSTYRGRVPPHLFPQWTFPLGAQILSAVPYKLTGALNAGCRLEIRAPLPAGEPLIVRGRLESVTDDGRRAILVQRFVTGTARVPEALIAETRAIVLLKSELPSFDKASQVPSRKAKPMVPVNAREIAFMELSRDAGLDFAKLTGDFNPIHWITPAAKAAGFRTCISHGFATMARAIEALNRAVFAGDASKLVAIDVRFGRPLPLPSSVGVYVATDAGNRGSGQIFVGDAPGGAAYLEGTFNSPVTTKATSKVAKDG